MLHPGYTMVGMLGIPGGTMVGMPGIPPMHHGGYVHPGIYTMVYPPGYTSQSPIPATVQAPRHRE